MLDRWGVIEGTLMPLKVRVVGPLPQRLLDSERLADKLQRDQKKLFMMMQYAKHEGDRKQFIHEYFGIG